MITLATVSVICAIAVLLSRRWRFRLAPAWLASISWSVSCLIAYRTILSAWPPLPWTTAAMDAEPWESVVYPVMLLCLMWPFVEERVKQRPRLNLLLVIFASAFLILATLCRTERYSALFAGNTDWAFAALVSVAINWWALDRLQHTGAGSWSSWIVVGQGMTIAAVIMTCYGRFGEWATSVAAALAVVSVARALVNDQESPWTSALSLPTLALNAVLIMHIREYRSNPLPAWFLPLPFLMPGCVAIVDLAWSGRFHPALRVVIAAIVTTVLAIVVIAIVLSINGPSEW